MDRVCKGFETHVGFWYPQILFQITPFCWGLALTGFKNSGWGFGLRLGPIAIAVWCWGKDNWRKEFWYG